MADTHWNARDVDNADWFEDDLERFIASESQDPRFANALRDAEARAHCVRELVAARTRNGLTQAQVAARMGTSQPTISEFESGGSDVYLSTLQRYARAVDACVRVTVILSEPDSGEDRFCGFGHSHVREVDIGIGGWSSTPRHRAPKQRLEATFTASA